MRRVYAILIKEIPDISKEHRLQIVIKTINDIVGPDRIILILLVYKVYSRISADDFLSASITQRAIAIKYTIANVCKYYIARKIIEVLRARNRSKINHFVDFLLGSDVLVYREKKG